MENVHVELNGNLLVIAIDLSQTLGVSSSGKSEIMATTGGNVAVPGHEEVKVGLNVYRPRKHRTVGPTRSRASSSASLAAWHCVRIGARMALVM